MPHRTIWLASIAGLLLGATPAIALDPGKGIGQYVYDSWGTRDGLPVASTISVARTRDGYLWVGTESGLLRFDGVRFTRLDRNRYPELRTSIIELLVDASDTLWAGTELGLVQWRDGVARRYTTADGLADNRVLTLMAARDGAIWVGTRAGLSRFQGGRFTSYTTRDGLPHDVVQYVAESRDGSVWIATNGGLAHLAEGRFTRYTTADGLTSALVQTVHEDRQGAVWIGTFTGLHRLAGGHMTVFTTRDGLSHNLVNEIIEDAAGTLWLSTYGGGLTRYRDGHFDTFTTAQGLASDFLNHTFLDDDGSLWLAMEHGGLGRLRDGPVTPYTVHEGLANDAVRVVMQDRAGAVWIGTHGGGLSRFQDGRFSTIGPKDGLPSGSVFSLAEDRRGRLWIGTHNGGLSRLDNGRLTTVASDALPRNHFVTAMHEDRAGVMWLGTFGGGLKRVIDDAVTSFTSRDGLTGDFVSSIVTDTDGGLWIGSGTGLTRYSQGRFTGFTTKDGLPDNDVNALYADPDGSVWVATEYGTLSRIRQGRIARVEPAAELFGDTIHGMLPDERGNLWCSTNRGIYRVSRQALHDAADGKPAALTATRYGIADGMKTAECNGSTQPAGWRGRDGHLWFPTQQGVVTLDPSRTDQTALAPPAIVEELIVDGRSTEAAPGIGVRPGQPVSAAARLAVLAPGSRQIELHYTSPFLRAPERVRFRYRLDGYDRDWVDAGSRRVAHYADLPPGRHQFRVTTAVEGGPWNPADVRLMLVVEPRFYQTWWFVAACGITAAGLVWTAHRYRVNQLLAMERVRTHIASDLHDDIGSSLSQIAILSEVVRARLAPAAPEVSEPLERIGALSRESVDAMGDIVWAISPHRNTPAHLSQRIRRLASDVLPARGIQLAFESTDDGHARLGIETRREVFLIFKEALNNIVRHAAASAVSIDIAIGRSGLRLVMTDDGRGFDPDAPVDGDGQGLASMRRRAAGLGGTLTVASTRDAGTRLELHLPRTDA